MPVSPTKFLAYTQAGMLPTVGITPALGGLGGGILGLLATKKFPLLARHPMLAMAAGTGLGALLANKLKESAGIGVPTINW